MPKALIFDVDGTLAETEDLHRKSFNQTFDEHGLDWHWDRKLYGDLLKVAGGQNRLRHFINEHQPTRANEFIGEVPQLHKYKTKIYRGLITTGEVELRPGIAQLIRQAIKDGKKLAIATSTSRINVDQLFIATIGMEILKNFDAICCGDDVDKVKPSPDLYNLALEKLDLLPHECLAIEDSKIGVTAARAAGVPVIVTKSFYCQGEDFADAKAVMDDLVSGQFKL